MGDGTKPMIPLILPWCNQYGKSMSVYDLIKSRAFSMTYITSIILIWYFLGFGHWGGQRCETLGEQLACASAIWPNEMFTAPHEYILSFITSPFFHNDSPHLIFVLIGIGVFCQSFEVSAGPKSTAFIFFSTIAFTGLTMGLAMNIGHWISPENTLFSHAMERSWMGGSVGMMGILGALSHYSRKKWIIPSIVILFEIWNRYENGMNEYITFGHLTSVLFGFTAWGWYLSHSRNKINPTSRV